MTGIIRATSKTSLLITNEKSGFRPTVDSVIFSKAVSLTPAMTSKLKVFHFIFLLSGLISISRAENERLNYVVKSIFLTRNFNSTDLELILKSARESFMLLKKAEAESDAGEKLNFVKNYANFLLKLIEDIKGKDFDIYQLFTKENSFLKGNATSQIGSEFNKTELKEQIENLQFAAEQNLVPHYNSSSECYNVAEILALNETSFDAFLKEKLRSDHSEIGYFFLEVFATLIGLSWGFISTVLYYGETSIGSISGMKPL